MPVARRPGQPFLVGRHQLAMNRTDGSFGIDVDQGRVETVPAPVQRTLDDADNDRNLAFGGQFAEWSQVSGFDLNGVVHVVGVDLFLHRRVETSAVGALDPEWVARQQSLAERDQIASLVGCAVGIRHHFGQCAISVQPDRGYLCDANQELITGNRCHVLVSWA